MMESHGSSNVRVARNHSYDSNMSVILGTVMSEHNDVQRDNWELCMLGMRTDRSAAGGRRGRRLSRVSDDTHIECQLSRRPGAAEGES
jgi:hypothetical protein